MRTYLLNYPGDPEAEVRFVTREEFFKLFPPETREVRIIAANETTVIPMGTTIICDLCNADCQGEICVVGMSKAYCEQCVKDMDLEKHMRIKPSVIGELEVGTVVQFTKYEYLNDPGYLIVRKVGSSEKGEFIVFLRQVRYIDGNWVRIGDPTPFVCNDPQRKCIVIGEVKLRKAK